MIGCSVCVPCPGEPIWLEGLGRILVSHTPWCSFARDDPSFARALLELRRDREKAAARAEDGGPMTASDEWSDADPGL